METTDGGRSWFPRSFTNLDAEEEINYRFEKVSFKDNEAWVIGKPAILLHSKVSSNCPFLNLCVQIFYFERIRLLQLSFTLRMEEKIGNV